MRFALKLISALAIPLAFIGAVQIAYSFAALYMLLVEGIPAGEPMWVDELAPSKGDAAVILGLGTSLVAFSLGIRAAIRRKLRS